MKYFSYLFLILICSCSQPAVESSNRPSVRVDTEMHGDTLVINSPSLLFMWPDSLQAEQMKSKDSDAFYTIADDYSFYNSQLMDIADSMKIKNFSTSTRFVEFNPADDKPFLIDRSKSEKLWWGLYLFNGKDAPQLQSTIDIDSKYLTNYFSK